MVYDTLQCSEDNYIAGYRSYTDRRLQASFLHQKTTYSGKLHCFRMT